MFLFGKKLRDINSNNYKNSIMPIITYFCIDE